MNIPQVWPLEKMSRSLPVRFVRMMMMINVLHIYSFMDDLIMPDEDHFSLSKVSQHVLISFECFLGSFTLHEAALPLQARALSRKCFVR